MLTDEDVEWLEYVKKWSLMYNREALDALSNAHEARTHVDRAIRIISRLSQTGAMVGEREALEKWYYSFLYSSASNKPFADALLASGIIARVPHRAEVHAAINAVLMGVVNSDNKAKYFLSGCIRWGLVERELNDAVLDLLKPKARP